MSGVFSVETTLNMFCGGGCVEAWNIDDRTTVLAKYTDRERLL